MAGARPAREAAYEAGLAGVDKGFGREPLPHERARGAVVDRVDEAADVVVDWTAAGAQGQAEAKT